MLILHVTRDHGEELCKILEQMGTDKKVHEVHGGVLTKRREEIRHGVINDAEQNHIIVATMGTTRRGVNIPNIDVIIYANPLKR